MRVGAVIRSNTVIYTCWVTYWVEDRACIWTSLGELCIYMYVYVCVYICICIYMYMCVCVCVWTYECVSVYWCGRLSLIHVYFTEYDLISELTLYLSRCQVSRVKQETLTRLEHLVPHPLQEALNCIRCYILLMLSVHWFMT